MHLHFSSAYSNTVRMHGDTPLIPFCSRTVVTNTTLSATAPHGALELASDNLIREAID
jgi:hypothetical protein